MLSCGNNYTRTRAEWELQLKDAFWVGATIKKTRAVWGLTGEKMRAVWMFQLKRRVLNRVAIKIARAEWEWQVKVHNMLSVATCSWIYYY